MKIMQLNNGLKPTDDATMDNNVLPLSAVLLDATLVSLIRKQALYTPDKEALHMHIHCTSRWLAGEEGDRFDAHQQVGGVA